jgi:hypothetical protein
MMKNLLIALLGSVTLTASVTIAQAETLKIGIGTQSEEYSSLIVSAMSEALEEYGYSAIAIPYADSQESLNNVLSGKIAAALSPLDVAARGMTSENDPNESLLLIGGKLIPEALFCAAYQGGSVMSYDDLTDEQEQPIKISVGNKTGTAARTFQYLMKLDSDLKNIEFFYEENTGLEFNRLLSGRRDLVCFVTMPNPDNEFVKTVVEHDELFFITLNHPSFDRAKIGKIRPYDIMEVAITNGFFGFNQKQVKTLVTWLGLVVNENKTEPKLLDALTTVVMEPDLLPSNSLLAKAKQLVDKAVTSIKEVIE